ncbi:hypothetical protein J2Y48_004778 [Mycoplana sp. BE70]|uniref:DUF982 domain-containing protein n=1 Tax=Mycoplana sp. BE70 TaxID=2817775 RepID=UPI00285DD8B1|nr:DUF982 domain-containing protein [Mycoplana sp. BE70]MDR6759462.1 hypothetical protein [Mycoplana sp. BE70]
MPLKLDWPKGVAIDLKGAGGFAVVRSTHEAAVYLTNCWPIVKGPAFNRALDLVRKNFDEEIDDETVRLAFVAAAEEAEVSVQLH